MRGWCRLAAQRWAARPPTWPLQHGRPWHVTLNKPNNHLLMGMAGGAPPSSTPTPPTPNFSQAVPVNRDLMDSRLGASGRPGESGLGAGTP